MTDMDCKNQLHHHRRQPTVRNGDMEMTTITVASLADAIGRRFTVGPNRFDLTADAVYVLSAHSMGGMLRDRSHALTDHVMTGAERYRDDYMNTRGPAGRVPHPSVTVYYVRDARSGRVAMARQADGTVLDELDTLRPDLRQSTRDAIRAAFVADSRNDDHLRGGEFARAAATDEDQFGAHGRCDTCGAPMDTPLCPSDPTHVVAVSA